ncbi:hypothetical protein [Miltoncostaea marina]|uniref:hypothetical protein n=1 Tax=Miltoncostaea marina TaxID=2843215 RepID=UPI001C3C36DC|nr:hypothetical protein [Miltoncostaea marina]
MTVALAIVAALAVLGLVVVALTGRAGPAKPLRGRTVVVHTRKPDDRSIRGVLVAEHRDRITLADAVYLTKDREIALDGLQHIPADAVAFIQEPS